MYCSNCGKEIPADANVCPGCGTVQNGSSAAKKPAVSADTPMTVGEWLITILLDMDPHCRVCYDVRLGIWAQRKSHKEKLGAGKSDLDGHRTGHIHSVRSLLHRRAVPRIQLNTNEQQTERAVCLLRLAFLSAESDYCARLAAKRDSPWCS